MSRAHNLLTRESWARADLRLPPEEALAMILHECAPTRSSTAPARSRAGGAGLDRRVRSGGLHPADALARKRRPPVRAPVAEGLRYPPAGAGFCREPERPARTRRRGSSTGRSIPCPPPAPRRPGRRRVRVPGGPDPGPARPAPARSAVDPGPSRHRPRPHAAGRRPPLAAARQDAMRACRRQVRL
ncbi:hypothetical protein ACRBEV_19010 [Methylobacterium phyllosphaerae]